MWLYSTGKKEILEQLTETVIKEMSQVVKDLDGIHLISCEIELFIIYFYTLFSYEKDGRPRSHEPRTN